MSSKRLLCWCRLALHRLDNAFLIFYLVSFCVKGETVWVPSFAPANSHAVEVTITVRATFGLI